jgi:hypothetical protein
MPQATYDDVNLILRLYDIRREDKLRAARSWFAQSFKVKSMQEFSALCPAGSEPNAFFRQVTSYWDMAASFVNAGVLNNELFFQSAREMLFVWMRVEPFIAEIRGAFKDPGYLKNLETIGKSYGDYFKKQSPEAFEAFVGRVRG